ncbi:GNAT family N-acetyltransferase [Anaerosporobacter sp.]|uniref:GNAT family N-acetyltransferase n=1 Tax=Anaerosporobacter sp. TaxID=1872529 RepID=UPI00286EB6D1|nr:GNAT family N-acetyltransferase [Anaerosporobacter sp.]
MTDIILIKPTMEYAEDILKFRQEILDSNDHDCFAGCNNLRECSSAEEWIKTADIMENEETCPKDRVLSNVYIAVRLSDNKIVGIIDLRHHINHPILSVWGGHIGYSVRPTERKKGYAKEMLRLNLHNCKKYGISKVMITCDCDNIASEKTILANGGIYEKDVCVDNSVIKRYWISL